MKVITAPARRGAPRKERQPVDHGTDQLRLRRILAVGPEADPALASTPLGIMLARKMIDLDMYGAGETFRRLYGGATGRARECGLDLNLGSGSDDALERITDQFWSLAEALARLDGGVHMPTSFLGRTPTRKSMRAGPIFTAVVDVAITQIYPFWLRCGLAQNDKRYWDIVKKQQHVDWVNLCTGLKELDKLMGRR